MKKQLQKLLAAGAVALCLAGCQGGKEQAAVTSAENPDTTVVSAEETSADEAAENTITVGVSLLNNAHVF